MTAMRVLCVPSAPPGLGDSGFGPFTAAAQAVAFDPASPFSYAVSNGMFFTIQ